MIISIRRPGFGGYVRSVTGAVFIVVVDDVSKGVGLFFASSAAVQVRAFSALYTGRSLGSI